MNEQSQEVPREAADDHADSRQKRNGLFLDERPICQACGSRPSQHAHHDLPKGHPQRFDHRFMRAVCEPCHIAIHQPVLWR